MNIKTITCHDVYNYGASLQAYALSTYLSNMGHDVEIINYKPDYLKHYKLSGLNNVAYNKPILREVYQVAKFPGRLAALYSRRKKAFDSFTTSYLPLTSNEYGSNEELIKNTPQSDVYIAGSDQIWNPLFKNGKDPAFFLDFVPDNKIKASYAASFSTDKISIEDGTRAYNWLKKFDAISVRESSGIKILEDIGIQNSKLVVDPVFLLSIDEWNKICPSRNYNDRYILLYDFDVNERISKGIKKYAANNGLKIYSIFNNKYADKLFYHAGPLEFISLIKNAEIVISNSFHATAFSLIFKKEFFVIKRKENLNARMEDLLSYVELSDRMMDDTLEFNSKAINYEIVMSKINDFIDDSKEYLNYVISLGER